MADYPPSHLLSGSYHSSDLQSPSYTSLNMCDPNLVVRGRTRITQAVGSQKTVIDYNGGPANLGPHRVLYTSGQGSSPLRASPVVACRALSATPLLLSGPLAVPGRGRYAPGAPPPMGRLYSIQGSAVGRVRASRLPRLCLGAVQAASKGSPRHTGAVKMSSF